MNVRIRSTARIVALACACLSVSARGTVTPPPSQGSSAAVSAVDEPASSDHPDPVTSSNSTTVPEIDDDVPSVLPRDAPLPAIPAPNGTDNHFTTVPPPEPLPQTLRPPPRRMHNSKAVSQSAPGAVPVLPSAIGPIDTLITLRIVARLVQLHLLATPADAMDPAVAGEAIKAFQNGVGIPPTGVLDRDTIGLLTS